MAKAMGAKGVEAVWEARGIYNGLSDVIELDQEILAFLKVLREAQEQPHVANKEA